MTTQTTPPLNQEVIELLKMLTGSTRPLAVVEAGTALFTTLDSIAAPIPAEAPAEHVFIPDISRRGPPSLG